jgi:capsular exopolysaccharide synthesis family protein
MSDQQQFFQEKPETNILVQILQRYLPFWPLFIVTIGIALCFSYLYHRAQTPIYVAGAKVLLKDPQKNGGDSKVLDALNIFSEKKIVENEILVLRSSSLMMRVVDSLDLYAQIFNEGKVRTEELYAENSPVLFRAMNKDSVFDGGKYYFSVNWKTNNIEIDGRNIPFNAVFNIGLTSYKAVINNSYNKSVVGKNYYAVFNSVGGAAGSLIGSLSASASSNTSTVIDVKMETPVPQKGKDVLNKLFEVYNNAAIVDKNQIAAKTLDFIEDRLKTVFKDLTGVEKEIEHFKASQGIGNLGGQAEMYLSSVKDLDKQNAEAELQIGVLNDISSYVNQKGRKPGMVPSLLLMKDPTLSGLLEDLYKAEFELEKVKSTSGEKSDAVILAEQGVSRIRGDIKENINNIKGTLYAVKSKVNAGISRNNSMLSSIPQKERILLDISREREIKNSIYIYLLTKREETALSSASTTADLRVLENAYATGPVKPVAKTIYLTGLLIGLLAAVLYVLMREQFNSKVLFRTEIEEKTSVPVVAEIVFTPVKDTIAIADGKRTIIAEQLRSLRTNLSFMGLNEENKTLLVTSSISGEGKSFIALNLAMSITLTGKRVALLEMDLRKPKLSKYLNISRDPGITNYLIGKVSINDIIKTTNYPNFYVVSAGPVPPNPTELITSENFGRMMQELKEQFDYVIIDSAPIGPVTDSLLLGKYAQTTLFVVRHGHTPKIFLKMIDELYKQKKFNNMCLLFNGLKRRGLLSSNYGYGYTGYGYGYTGYGYYINDKQKPGWKNGWGIVGYVKGLFGG